MLTQAFTTDTNSELITDVLRFDQAGAEGTALEILV